MKCQAAIYNCLDEVSIIYVYLNIIPEVKAHPPVIWHGMLPVPHDREDYSRMVAERML